MSVIGEFMNTLEAIEKGLREMREALANAEGRDAEVYSRIVGYYRSVRNWNKGKREEFGERKMFQPPVFTGNEATGNSAGSESGFCESCALPANADTEDDAAFRLVQIPAVQAGTLTASTGTTGRSVSTDGDIAPSGLFQDADLSGADSCSMREIEANPRILLFVRQGCPSCPAAKAEAGKLAENFGVCVVTVNADTEAGLAEARRLGVTATPTAILLRNNAELSRAKDRDEIAGMRRFFEPLKQSA
jgi:ribonucleoside-triphosphate reductase